MARSNYSISIVSPEFDSSSSSGLPPPEATGGEVEDGASILLPVFV
jgi:hypothetical protein